MSVFYQDNYITIYHGDSLAILPGLPAESFDAIITDPPYGTKTKPRGDRWMVGEFANIIPLVLPEMYRVGSATCALYSFTSWTWMADWIMRCSPYFRMQNFIIWDKQRHSGRWTQYAWQFCWEGIYYGIKGPRDIREYQPDVVRTGEKTQYPMQKPVDIVSKFIRASTDEGQIILDPFTGTGGVLVAAKRLKRRAVGIEIEESQAEIAANRVRQDMCFET